MARYSIYFDSDLRVGENINSPHPHDYDGGFVWAKNLTLRQAFAEFEKHRKRVMHAQNMVIARDDNGIVVKCGFWRDFEFTELGLKSRVLSKNKTSGKQHG